MSFIKKLRLLLIAGLLSLGAAGAMAATPGCIGKMWNPLADLDFTLMGGMKIAGIKLMASPDLGEPPKHKTKTICFCKDGLQTGLGLGLTFWLPSYIADLARQAGCMGFLNGINMLPGFISLSSGQRYSQHRQSQEGTTNMQLHWAYADVVAIMGKNLLEKCNAVTGSMTIPYMSEIDPVFQSDVISVIMTPQASLLASVPLITMMACAAEETANTLGSWQDWGVCSFGGVRYPLSGVSTSKSMAQVTNMDVTIKYLTRAAMLAMQLRTMGEGTECRPQVNPFYDPFQHRYQWSFPGKTATRYNQNVMRWGMYIRDAKQGSLMSMGDQAAQLGSFNATKQTGESPDGSKSGEAPTAYAKAMAERLVASLPKPLNYPTHEAGFMQVWEARNCCLVVLTIETVMKMAASSFLPDGILKDLYDAYNTVSSVYDVIKDPIGGAIGAVGNGISAGIAWLGS